MNSSLRFFHSFINPLIAQRRRKTSDSHDLLAALLSATFADDGAQLSDREAVDEALTILLAESDTTAAAISWSAYLLAKHPKVQRQLRKELRVTSPNGTGGGDPGPQLPIAEE